MTEERKKESDQAKEAKEDWLSVAGDIRTGKDTEKNVDGRR